MEIRIYQVNTDRDTKRIAFSPLAEMQKIQGNTNINWDIYDMVFMGDVKAKTLEDVFTMFNSNPPEGYTGRSLSVSDIVAVNRSSKDTISIEYYYCDRIGFKKITPFGKISLEDFLSYFGFSYQINAEENFINLLDLQEANLGNIEDDQFPFGTDVEGALDVVGAVMGIIERLDIYINDYLRGEYIQTVPQRENSDSATLEELYQDALAIGREVELPMMFYILHPDYIFVDPHKDTALAACTQNGLALQYADDSLKNEDDFASPQNPIDFAACELISSYQLCIKAAREEEITVWCGDLGNQFKRGVPYATCKELYTKALLCIGMTLEEYQSSDLRYGGYKLSMRVYQGLGLPIPKEYQKQLDHENNMVSAETMSEEAKEQFIIKIESTPKTDVTTNDLDLYNKLVSKRTHEKEHRIFVVDSIRKLCTELHLDIPTDLNSQLEDILKDCKKYKC